MCSPEKSCKEWTQLPQGSVLTVEPVIREGAVCLLPMKKQGGVWGRMTAVMWFSPASTYQKTVFPAVWILFCFSSLWCKDRTQGLEDAEQVLSCGRSVLHSLFFPLSLLLWVQEEACLSRPWAKEEAIVMLPNSSHPTTLRSALCRTFLIAQEWQKGRHREVAQVHRKSWSKGSSLKVSFQE